MKSIHTFELPQYSHSSSSDSANDAAGPKSPLSSLQALLKEAQAADALKLVNSKGEEAAIPEVLLPVFRQLLRALIAGEKVSLVSGSDQLTTQQAADILNISRPYMVKLLEDGKLPFTRTGKHRRVNVMDLLSFKEARDAQHRQGLAALTRMGEEMGDYEITSDHA